LAFIGDVVAQIDALVPIPHASGRTFLAWCGHQHVPGETRRDPGAIDIAAILI